MVQPWNSIYEPMITFLKSWLLISPALRNINLKGMLRDRIWHYVWLEVWCAKCIVWPIKSQQKKCQVIFKKETYYCDFSCSLVDLMDYVFCTKWNLGISALLFAHVTGKRWCIISDLFIITNAWGVNHTVCLRGIRYLTMFNASDIFLEDLIVSFTLLTGFVSPICCSLVVFLCHCFHESEDKKLKVFSTQKQ